MDTATWQGRILLADALATNQLIISMLLKKLGIHIDVVDSSTAAQQALEEQSYDMALLSCQLEPNDGYQLSQHIRTQESAEQHLIIVALATDSSMETMLRCAEVGMDDVLATPLNTNELLYCLERWESRSGLQKQIHEKKSQKISEVEQINTINIVVLEKLKTDLEPEFDRVFQTALNTLSDYFHYVQQHIQQLDEYCDEELTRHIHSFKSTSATLGGEDMSRFAQRLENQSKKGDVQALKQAQQTLEQKYQQFYAALKQWQQSR